MDKRILWIEDEPESYGANTRIKMLKMKGYEATLLKTIDEALKCIKKQAFDLILLDIMMPPGKAFQDIDVKGGYETGLAFMEELRKLKIKIPVIVTTAYPNPGVEHISREQYSVKYYFHKPINQDELEDAIEETLTNTLTASV